MRTQDTWVTHKPLTPVLRHKSTLIFKPNRKLKEELFSWPRSRGRPAFPSFNGCSILTNASELLSKSYKVNTVPPNSQNMNAWSWAQERSYLSHKTFSLQANMKSSWGVLSITAQKLTDIARRATWSALRDLSLPKWRQNLGLICRGEFQESVWSPAEIYSKNVFIEHRHWVGSGDRFTKRTVVHSQGRP